jgi:CheY-like chemotaxis protein
MLSYEKEPKRTELRARNYGGNRRTRCLVIEDDADTTHYICNGLEEAGFTVVWVCDGVDGVRLATDESWDVMILDRMLPGDIDGLSIVQTVREARKTTPVLILSALASLDERIRGLRSGGDDYLTKPFAFSVSIVVQDDGPGIPSEERAKVVTRFYRLDRSRSLPGNGLGLPIVTAISHLHSGTFSFGDGGPGLIARIVLPSVDAKTFPNGNLMETAAIGTPN